MKRLIYEVEDKIKYGIVMLNLQIPNWSAILKQVNKDDLFTDGGRGLEEEPHVTLLYGLHKTIDDTKLLKYLQTIPPLKIKMVDVDCFYNDEFDVLKVNCSADSIEKYRNVLMKNFDNTQTFSGFHPHITIAYLKKGRGKKYQNKASIDKEFICDEIIYSNPNKNSKEIIKLQRK